MMVYAETKECGNSFIQSPRKPPQAPPKEGMLPNGMPKGSVKADRRGRLSLQIPYFSNRANNLFTRQLPTRQLYLITILNCEL